LSSIRGQNNPLGRFVRSSLLFSLYSVLHCRLHRELGLILADILASLICGLWLVQLSQTQETLICTGVRLLAIQFDYILSRDSRCLFGQM